MQVFQLSPSPQAELPSSGSAATTNADSGFSQVLARQQSDRSTGAAASGQASGSSPASPSSADAGEAAAPAPADSQPDSRDARGHADAPGQAATPLADMVRDLTARSRAVAAGSLERSAVAQAARIAGADAATSRGLELTRRPSRDASATEDLAIALDPASIRSDADRLSVRKSATKPGETPDPSLPHEDALALMTPDVDARTPMAAGRDPLSGQGRAEALPTLAQAGNLRDAGPDRAADTLAARDLGLAGRRDDILIPARDASTPASDGKPLTGQAFESLFANALPGAQPGEASVALNPVSSIAPAVTGMTSGVASPASILTGSIPVPVGSPQWAPAFSEQMVQIGTQQGGTLHHAELRLDPPDLGPLRVSISMQGEQATATFISPHASVRSAVEAALPQLMQALADAGINLGDTSVGEQDAREFAAENARRAEGRDANDTDEGHVPMQAVVQTRPRGLVDTFA